jgi:hypothetical protein
MIPRNSGFGRVRSWRSFCWEGGSPAAVSSGEIETGKKSVSRNARRVS